MQNFALNVSAHNAAHITVIYYGQRKHSNYAISLWACVCVCEKIEIQIQTAQIEQFDRERMNSDDKWRTRIGKNGSTNVQFVR